MNKWGANYEPDRTNGWLTFRNEYKKANVRLTLQATQKNKFNIYWDEQSSCTNPCYGMINVVDSPEGYGSLQSYPNRLTQLSWTNPFTNRMLFEAGLSYISTHEDITKHREFSNPRTIPRICEAGPTVGRDEVAIKVNTSVTNTIGGARHVRHLQHDDLRIHQLQFPDGDRTSAQRRHVPEPRGRVVHHRRTQCQDWVRGRLLLGENPKRGQRSAAQLPLPDASHDGHLEHHDAKRELSAGSSRPAVSLRQHEPVLPGGRHQHIPAYQTCRVPDEHRRAISDERVWFGALYLQDQWTLNRFTINGALRYDHAESRYGASCIGPDVLVPVQTAMRSNHGARRRPRACSYNDITPRWGVAWDVFGNGKTSVKWNMGKYLTGRESGRAVHRR